MTSVMRHRSRVSNWEVRLVWTGETSVFVNKPAFKTTIYEKVRNGRPVFYVAIKFYVAVEVAHRELVPNSFFRMRFLRKCP